MAKKKSTGAAKKTGRGGAKGGGAAVEVPEKVPAPALRRTTRSQHAAEPADDPVATQACHAMLDLASGAASPGTNTAQGAPASGAGGVGIAPRSSRACKKPVGHYATPPRGRRETGSPGSPAGDSSSGLAQAPPASTERRSTSSGEPSNARAGRSGRSGRGGATQSRAVGHEDDTSASTSGSSKRKVRTSASALVYMKLGSRRGWCVCVCVRAGIA